jgi:hypothetical protein
VHGCALSSPRPLACERLVAALDNPLGTDGRRSVDHDHLQSSSSSLEYLDLDLECAGCNLFPGTPASTSR